MDIEGRDVVLIEGDSGDRIGNGAIITGLSVVGLLTVYFIFEVLFPAETILRNTGEYVLCGLLLCLLIVGLVKVVVGISGMATDS